MACRLVVHKLGVKWYAGILLIIMIIFKIFLNFFVVMYWIIFTLSGMFSTFYIRLTNKISPVYAEHLRLNDWINSYSNKLTTLSCVVIFVTLRQTETILWPLQFNIYIVQERIWEHVILCYNISIPLKDELHNQHVATCIYDICLFIQKKIAKSYQFICKQYKT